MIEKNTNVVHLIGKVQNLKFEYQKSYDAFYTFELHSKRLSGVEDIIKVYYSEIDCKGLKEGDIVEIHGEFRSKNESDGEKTHLILRVFAKDIMIFKNDDEVKDVNDIHLTGRVCKPTNYRTTPNGKEVCDLFLAVNRRYKSDYIPCICWNRIARHAKLFNLGDNISISGRIQSRVYTNMKGETKTAYEVSIITCEVIK